MKKILLLFILSLSSIYALSNLDNVKVYNIEKNSSSGMRFSIDLLDTNLSVQNIQFKKHANLWHFSMNKANLSKDFDISKTNGSTDLKIIHQKTGKLDYKLSNDEFYKILKFSLLHIKKEFPSIYFSHIRISTPLVTGLWENILPLSVKAMQAEKGPFILKENSTYDKVLQTLVNDNHGFIEKSCQIIKSVFTLECDKNRPIYVKNHSFNKKYMGENLSWKEMYLLKEKAFDRKSDKSSYIRFNFTNNISIQDEMHLDSTIK